MIVDTETGDARSLAARRRGREARSKPPYRVVARRGGRGRPLVASPRGRSTSSSSSSTAATRSSSSRTRARPSSASTASRRNEPIPELEHAGEALGERLRGAGRPPGRRPLGDPGLRPLIGTLGLWPSSSARFEKVLRVGEGRRIKRLPQQADYIGTLEPDFEKLTDEELAGQDGRVQAADRERRAPGRPPLRGVRRGARGVQAHDRRPALRRPADGRHRPPRGRHRRDEDRRGQDLRRHAGALPERAHRPRHAPRHGQRLPRPARPRVDARPSSSCSACARPRSRT